MMSHPLLPKLRQLNLSGILNTLDVRVSQAASDSGVYFKIRHHEGPSSRRMKKFLPKKTKKWNSAKVTNYDKNRSK